MFFTHQLQYQRHYIQKGCANMGFYGFDGIAKIIPENAWNHKKTEICEDAVSSLKCAITLKPTL